MPFLDYEDLRSSYDNKQFVGNDDKALKLTDQGLEIAFSCYNLEY